MGIVHAGLHAAFEEMKELLLREERDALSELGDAQVVNAADREER
jgi:hypothetical protein